MKSVYYSKIDKAQMIKWGATGKLNFAYERYIPIHKITGLDPEPTDWTDGNEVKQYTKGQPIEIPIEVKYNKEDDLYYLEDGNHRIKQAKINGDYYIRAFIEPDRGKIGDEVKTVLRENKTFVLSEALFYQFYKDRKK